MNSAFTDNQAARKAVRIAHVALRGALACALVFGAGGVSAQQYGNERGADRGSDRRDDAPQHQARERFSLPQDRGGRDGGARGYDDPRRGQQSYPQAQDQYDQPRDESRRGSGRLTPDERRDLRRQINEANMDLYQRKR